MSKKTSKIGNSGILAAALLFSVMIVPTAVADRSGGENVDPIEVGTYQDGSISGQGGAFYQTIVTAINNGTKFKNNTATGRGGAIYSTAAMTVNGGEFTGNSSSGGDGGAIVLRAEGAPAVSSIINSSFSNNTATGTADSDSGAVSIQNAVLSISNSTFTSNEAKTGGAIYAYKGTVGDAGYVKTTITDSSFLSNKAIGNDNSNSGGGAIGNVAIRTRNGGDAGMWIVNTNFANNSNTVDNVNGGGAIFAGSESRTNISGTTTFTGNTSASSGGAIGTRNFNLGVNTNAVMDIVGATFTSNTAATNGGAIDNNFYNSDTHSGSVYVKDSAFTTNSAAKGGAIYNHISQTGDAHQGQVGNMYIEGSTFTGNTASARGGAIFNEGTLTIDGGEFDSNTATSYGGAVFSSGQTTINNSEFTNNYSDYVGGAITTVAGTTSNLSVDNTIFENNHTRYDGGAIGNYSGLTISNSTFTGNTADYLADTSGDYTILVEDDTAIGGGAISLGAVSATSIGSITETTFTDNKSGTYGGAIGTRFGKDADNSAAKLDISADFSDNEAHISGGAIYNTFYTNNGLGKGDGVTVTGTFDGNIAGQNGGAIYNDGALDKKNNHGGVMTITDSAFTNNVAGVAGGAIYNSKDAILTVAANNADVTFSGNTANGDANDIYNVGTLNLNAAAGKSISLEGGITGDNASVATNLVNIAGTVSGDNIGTVELSTIENQTVSVNSGELHISTTATDGSNVAGSAITVANGAVINTIDGAINDYMTGGDGKGTITLADGAKIKGDVNFIAGTSDKYAATTGATVKYSVASLIGDIGGGDQTIQVVSNGATVDINEAVFNSETGLSFQSSGSADGKMIVKGVAGGINGAVDGTTDTGSKSTVNYTVTGNETFDGAGGTDNVIANSDFTINGQGTGATDPAISLATDMIIGDAAKPSTLTLNNAKLTGTKVLQNTAGSSLDINNSLVEVLVKNYGTLNSDPTTYKGGVENYLGANATITGDTFTDIDRTGNNGGAIWNEAGGTLTLNTDTFTNNKADNGGALYNQGTATINGGTFTGNTATALGGAIYSKADLAINSTTAEGSATFSGNADSNGANDIYMLGTSDTSRVTLSLNAVDDTNKISLGSGVAGQYYDVNVNNGTAGTVELGAVTGVNTLTVNNGTVTTTGFDAKDLTVSAGTLTTSGAATIMGGSNAGTIDGAGALTFGDGTTTVTYGNTGLIKNAITNTANSTFTTKGSNNATPASATAGIINTVTNAGTLSITDGYVVADVSGAGALETANGVTINSGVTVEQGTVEVTGTLANAGTLTVNGDLTDGGSGAITGAGDINLNGGNTTTLATNAVAINSTGDVSVGGYVSTSAAITADDISVTGKLVADADKLTDSNDASIANAGTLELTGGTDIDNTVTNANAVTGTGSTIISGNVTQTAGKAIATSGGISVTGGLVANADDLDAAVANSGTIRLNGGQLDNAITGAGTTEVSGAVTNASTINGNEISILAGGSLTTDADAVTDKDASIANAGTLDLTGGTDIDNTVTNANAVTGAGATVISGNVTQTAGKAIAGSGITVTGGLVANADDLDAAVANSGTIRLNGGQLDNAITGAGTTEVSGAVTNASTINGNEISILAGGSLTTDADAVTDKDASIANAGTLELTGGTDIDNTVTNANAVTGTGSTIISGNVTQTAGKAIAGSGITVTGGLVADAGDLGAAVDNTGTLQLTGGTLANAVTGAGLTNITGAVTQTASNANAIEITSTGALTTATTDLTNSTAIKNDGTLTFNDTAATATIAQDITKNTSGGTVEIAAGTDSVISMASGKTISDNILKLTSGTFDAGTASGVVDMTGLTKILANGGNLSVVDDKTGTITLGVVDASGQTFNVDIDVNIVGDGSADLLSVAGTSALTNKITLDNINIITGSGSKTGVKIYVTDTSVADGDVTVSGTTYTPSAAIGGLKMVLGYTDGVGTYLTVSHSDLANAITSSIEEKSYKLTADEAFANPATLGGTSLTIDGDGHTISGTSSANGIVIANGSQTLTITNATVASFGSGNSAIVNAGSTINLEDVTMNGDISGAGVTNLKGSTSVGTGATIAQTTVNVNSGSSSTDVVNNGVITANVENAANSSLVNNGTVNGYVVNWGDLTNNSGKAINGSVENMPNANFVNDGTVTNIEANRGTVTNNATGVISGYVVNGHTDGAGTFNNYGTVGQLTNLQGTSTNYGTITTVASNPAGQTIDNQGTITNVTSNAGTFNNSLATSQVTGNFTNDGGDVTNAGVMTTITNNSGTITNTGAGEITSGITNTGTINSAADKLATTTGGIDNSGTLNLTGSNVVLKPVVADSNGTGITNINGTITFGNKVTQNAINVNAGGALTSNADYVDGAVTNVVDSGLILTSGTLGKDVSGAGSTLINTTSTVTNTATIAQDVEVAAGEFINSTGSVTGGLTVDAGATGTISGGSLADVTNQGTFNVKGGTISGAYTQTAANTTTNVTDGAALDLSGTSVVSDGAIVLGDSTTTGALTVQNGLTTNAAAITTNGASALDILGGSTFTTKTGSNIADAAAVTLGGATAGTLDVNAGTVTLDTNDTWNDNGTVKVTGGILNLGGVNQAGPLDQTTGTGTTNIIADQTLNDNAIITAGSFNILNGKLTVNGATINPTDGITIASGTTLDIASGSMTLDGGSTLGKVTWDGTVELNGGSLTLANIVDQSRATTYNKTGVLTAKTGNLTIDSTSVLLGDNDTIAQAVTLNLNGADLYIGKSGAETANVYVDSADTLSGDVILANSGTLTLDGVTTVNGTSSVQAAGGRLNIVDTVSSAGTTLASDDDTIAKSVVTNVNADLTINNNNAAGVVLNNIGSSTVEDSWTKGITLSGGKLTLDDVHVTTDGTVTYNQDGGYLKLDGSDLELTAGSVITGGTVSIDPSTLVFNNGADNSATILMTVDDGSSLTVKGANTTLTLLTGTDIDYGTVTNGDATNANVINVANNSNIAKAVVMDLQANSITNLKDTADLTMNENDNWKGDIVQTGGTLRIEGAVNDTVKTGSLQTSSGNVIVGDGAANAGSLNLNNANDVIAQNAIVVINNNGALNITRGEVTLDNVAGTADTWSGQIAVENTGVLNLYHRLDLDTTDGTKTYNQNGGELNLDASTLTLGTAASRIIDGDVNLKNASSLTIDNGSTQNQAQVVTDGTTVNKLTLGNTTGNPTLKLTDASEISKGDQVSIASGATLEITGTSANGVSLNAGGGADTWDGNVVVAGGATTPAILNISDNLTKTGTLTQNTANSTTNILDNFTITTGDSIVAGKLNIGDGATTSKLTTDGTASIAKDAVVTITDKATLDVAGGTVTLDSDTGTADTWTGAITQSAGTLKLVDRADATTATQTYNMTGGTLTLEDSSLALNTLDSQAQNGTINLTGSTTTSGGSQLTFDNGVANDAIIVSDGNVNNALTVGGVNTSDSELTLNSGSSIDKETAVTIVANGILNATGTSIQGGGSDGITNDGIFNLANDGATAGTIDRAIDNAAGDGTTGTVNLTGETESTANGTINQANVTVGDDSGAAGSNTSVFTAGADVTANTMLTVNQDGQIVNGANDITAEQLTVDAGASIVGTSATTAGDLTVNNGGSNAGTIEQNDIDLTAGNFDNDGDITAIHDFTNGAVLDNDADIVVGNQFTNTNTITTASDTGTITVANGGSSTADITQAAMELTGGAFDNDADITTSGDFTTGAALDNDADINVGGTFTNTGAITTASDSGTITTAAGGSNTGTIAQKDMTLNGTTLFDNDGDVTLSGVLTNAAPLDNDADITADTFVNSGVVTTAGDSGTITVANGGSSTADITQAAMELTAGNFDNDADITTSGAFTTGANLDNDADITAGGTFTNTGAITTASDSGTITTAAGGSNTGAIAQKDMTLNGTTLFDNDGDVTLSGVLTNAAPLDNDADIIADTFVNSGVVTTAGDTGTITVANGGSSTADITQESMTLTAGNFDNDADITTSGDFTTGANLDNDGDITVGDQFVNTGVITTATDTGTLTVANGGSSTGDITQNEVTLNNASGTAAFDNDADITTSGAFTNATALDNDADITAGGTFTNTGDITTASDSGTITTAAGGSNTGTIAQKDMTLNGTTLFDNDGDVTLSGVLTNAAPLDNDADIIADTFVNSGVVTTASDSGTITVANGGSSTADITQESMTLTAGNFDNDADITTSGDFTTGANLDNDGDITVGDQFVNTGVITTATDTGTLTVANGGSSTGNITQNEVTLNNASGTAAFDNDADITTSGAFTNATALDNDADITAGGTFTNTGDITTASDSGTITTAAGGSNTGTIAQKDMTLNGTTLFDNDGDVTLSGVLTNAAPLDNDADITADTFVNSGVVTTASDSGTITVANGGSSTADITQESMTLTAGNFDNDADITTSGDFTTGANLDNDGDITVGDQFVNTGVITTASDTGTLTVANGGSSTGDITQKDVTLNDASGTAAFDNDADITTSNNFTTNLDLDNDGDIDVGNQFVNTGVITTASDSGTITVGNGGSSTGDITQAAMEFTAGNFDNDADITTSGLLHNVGATIDNDADITAGQFQNEAGGTITTASDTGTLTVDGVSYNKGNIDQDTVEVAGGTFTNDAGATITGNTVQNDAGATLNNDGAIGTAADPVGQVTNNGTMLANGATGTIDATTVDNNTAMDNDGTVNSVDTNNNAGATLTNDGDYTSTGTFTNAAGATVNNDGTEGNGTLNVNDGTNSGAITQGIMDVAAGNTGFTNDSTGTIAIEDTLTNNGTMDNDNTITANNTTGDAQVDNKGTLNNNDGSNVTANDIANTGTVNMDGNSTLAATDETSGVGGTINVTDTTGTGSASTIDVVAAATGGNQDITGTVNVGNGTGAGDLDLTSGDITSGATLNLDSGSVLNIDDSASAGSASAVIDSADNWAGDVTNNSGAVELDGLTVTTDDTSTTAGGTGPFLSQTDGDLTLTNTTLTMEDASLINGNGSITVDPTSTFNADSGAFTVDKLQNGGTVNAINGAYDQYVVDGTTPGTDGLIAGDGTSTQGDFTADIYARSNQNKNYDQYGDANAALSSANGTNGTLNISDFQLNGDIMGADAPIDRNIVLDNFFLYDPTNTDGSDIKFTATNKTVATPIGNFGLASMGNGTYGFMLKSYNPQVFRGQVTTLAQYQNQLAIDDMIFNHTMVNNGFKGNDYLSGHPNLYASSGDLYAPYQYSRKDGGIWVKNYGTFEHLKLDGMDVGNNSYGTLIGADFGLKDLKHGWQFMPTAYLGYNGAHQHWDGISAYQNGGQLGFLGTWYKNDFMLGTMLYGGLYGNDMKTPRGTDTALGYFAGAATKAAYNWRFLRDFSLQPNLMVSYNFFGKQNWSSSFGQMDMQSGMLNGINVAPGVNLIWERETFSAYATVQYMININDGVDGKAGNVDLPTERMGDGGYIQYGVGVNKKFTDRFSAFFQVVARNICRTGIGLQLGLNWKVGKAPVQSTTKKSTALPQKDQTKMNVSSAKKTTK